MAAKSARQRASTGLATADGAGAAAATTFALERRTTTFHAATGIAAQSAASTRRAVVGIVRFRMMCLSMALQAAERDAPRPGWQRCAIDTPVRFE